MSVIRAHFDGKVFVPEAAVEIPLGTPVEVIVPSAAPVPRLSELIKLMESLPDDSDLPADASMEVDHYLYGHPKRGST